MTGRSADQVTIAIAAPPIEGRANEALVEFLAEELGLPRRQIRIFRGATARRKLVDIDAPRELVDAWLDRVG